MVPFELSPIIVGIFGVSAGVLMVATFHCIRVCLEYGHGRRRRRSAAAPPLPTGRGQTVGRHNYQEDASTSSNVNGNGSGSGSFSTIRLLVATNFSGECKEETCSVCLSEFNEGDEVRVLPGCAHVFHVLCIDKWLFSHSNCPLCRANALCSLRDTPVDDSPSNTGGVVVGTTPPPGGQGS